MTNLSWIMDNYPELILSAICDGEAIGINRITGTPNLCKNMNCEKCIFFLEEDNS